MNNKISCEKIGKWEEYQVSEQLAALPFDTSLSGYSMLSEAIISFLRKNKHVENMNTEIYADIAKQRNVSVSSVEKNIKFAIESVSNSSISMKDFVVPNMLIKNALSAGKPKRFISAVCEVVKQLKIKHDMYI